MTPSSPFRPAPVTPIAAGIQAEHGGRTTRTSSGLASLAPGSATPSAGGIVSELLTTKQAAELLQVGERTLWRWSRSGLAPKPLKISAGKQGSVRFRRSDLLQWIQNGCKRVDGRATA